MTIVGEHGDIKEDSIPDSSVGSLDVIAMASKYFSRHEAEQLLPLIEEFLRMAQEQKQTVDAAQVELTKSAARIMALGGSYPPYSELVKKKTERDQASAKIVEAITKIQETGCLVKDIEEGLVDFPSLIEGEEAFLCWKLGEKRIEYWHGLNDGFAGRKRLDGRPSGDSPSGSSRVQ